MSLMVFTSCYGKWNVEIKHACSNDGSMTSEYDLYPRDKEALENFDNLMREIKNEEPESVEIRQLPDGKKYIFTTEKLSPDKNEFLKKKDGRWIFSRHDDSGSGFMITRVVLIMPGWITKSNASYHYMNRAVWEEDSIPDTFTAESTIMPYELILAFILFAVLVIISIILYVKFRAKQDVS